MGFKPRALGVTTLKGRLKRDAPRLYPPPPSVSAVGAGGQCRAPKMEIARLPHYPRLCWLSCLPRGTGLLFKKAIDVKKIAAGEKWSFEYSELTKG